jgi:hypothetical protein
VPGLHHEAVPQAAKVRNEPCGVEFWEFFGNPHAKIMALIVLAVDIGYEGLA